MIQPLPTHYNGYRFRSRTEARWAVFFDTMGIRYEYEPQGYLLDGSDCYLPDFWLPELNCWFEVKGVDPTPVDVRKAIALARETKTGVIVAIGAPWWDTDYLLTGENPFEGAFPFDGWDGVGPAFNAARSARFEFGETPIISPRFAS